METHRKKILALSLVLLLATVVGAAIAAKIYWTRTMQPTTFDIKGVNAEVLKLGYDNYRNKVVATTLDSNGQAIITIYYENFNQVWLNTQVQTNATGLTFSMMGQYVVYQCLFIADLYVKTTTLQGSPFDISGNHTITKQSMMWHDPGEVPGPAGYGLIVTILPQTLEYPIPGHYSMTVSFEMGYT